MTARGRRPPIRILDVAGSPEAIGHAHGSAFADEIRVYTDDRVALVASGLWSGGPIDRADVLDIASSMLPAHEAFDAGLYAEMVSLAAAAGITPAEAVVVGGFTDFVDTVRAVVGGSAPVSVIEDDCTATIVPDGRADGAGFLAQTWDMHDTATDHVLLLRVQPDDGPNAVGAARRAARRPTDRPHQPRGRSARAGGPRREAPDPAGQLDTTPRPGA